MSGGWPDPYDPKPLSPRTKAALAAGVKGFFTAFLATFLVMAVGVSFTGGFMLGGWLTMFIVAGVAAVLAAGRHGALALTGEPMAGELTEEQAIESILDQIGERFARGEIDQLRMEQDIQATLEGKAILDQNGEPIYYDDRVLNQGYTTKKYHGEPSSGGGDPFGPSEPDVW